MAKNQITFIVGLILAIIISIFALTNANSININLIFYKVQASQALVIIFSAAIGAIIVMLLGMVNHIKMKIEIMTLKKELEKLKKDHDDRKTESDMISEPTEEK